MNGQRKGYVLAALAALQWSTMGILGKLLFGFGAPPLTVVTLRATLLLLALAVILLLFQRSSLRIRARDGFFFAAYGLLGVACGFFFFFTAVSRIGVTVASFLLYTYPVFVTLLSAVLLKERITPLKVAALVLSLAGIALLSEMYEPLSARVETRGVLLALLAAVSGASYSIFGKKAVQRYSSWTVLFWSTGFAALFLVAAQLVFLGRPALAHPAPFWGWLLMLVFIPSLGGSLAYISALKRIEASRASITATVEPVAAGILAYGFFRESLSPSQILGTALVLAGVILVQWRSPGREAAGPPS